MPERVPPQVRQLPFPCTSFLIQYSPSSVPQCEMWCCHVGESVLILALSAKGGDRAFLLATWHCSPEDQYQHLHCHEYHKSPASNLIPVTCWLQRRNHCAMKFRISDQFHHAKFALKSYQLLSWWSSFLHFMGPKASLQCSQVSPWRWV
jgi:hypothetical protein